MPRYDVVLFDFDNTLSDFASARDEALPALLERHGIDDPGDHVGLFQRLAAPLWEQLERGSIGLDTLNVERFRRFVEAIDACVPAEELAPQYLDLLAVSGQLVPGARDLLAALHGRVRIGLVTNGYAEVQRPRLEHFGLAGYFDAVTVSSEVGCAKPSREFFEAALGSIGSPDPSSTLVVGDSVSSDMVGAAAVGCATGWFNPTAQPVPGEPRIDHDIRSLADVAELISVA